MAPPCLGEAPLPLKVALISSNDIFAFLIATAGHGPTSFVTKALCLGSIDVPLDKAGDLGEALSRLLMEAFRHMKLAKYMAFLSVFTLLLPLSALAKDKNERSVNIPNTVQVGSTQLKPGDYKVEWQEAGPAVQVKFLRYGKTVATASGTLKTNDSQVTQDDIVTQQVNPHQNVLKEIDFGHQKEALLFG